MLNLPRSAPAGVCRVAVAAGLLVCAAALPAAPAGGDLAIAIRTDRPTYRVGDPVAVLGAVTNRSTRALTVNARFSFPGPEIYLEITDADGQRLRWSIPEPPQPVTRQQLVDLPPGAVLPFRLDHVERALHQPLLPGRYQVVATYRHLERDVLGTAVWQGVVRSEPVALVVTD